MISPQVEKYHYEGGISMWTRAELKSKAKFSFKRNYWKSVLISLILALLVGGGSSGSSRGSRSRRSGAGGSGRTAAGSQSCTNGHGTGSEQEITARDLFHKGKPPSWFSIICKSFLHKRFRSKSLWRHIKEC